MMQDLQFLENYLFDEENVLSKLIVGTDKYYYYTLLKQFNENGFQNDQATLEMMEEFKKIGGDLYEKLEFRYLFLEYDYWDQQQSNSEIVSKKRSILQRLQEKLLSNEDDENDEFIDDVFKYKENQSDQDPNEQIQEMIEECLSEGFEEASLYLLNLVDVNLLLRQQPDVIASYVKRQGRRFINCLNSPQLLNILVENGLKIDYQNMSLEQMDQLLFLNEKILNDELFVQEYYNKQYNKQQSQDNDSDILREFYLWSLKLPPKYKILSDHIMQKLLKLGQQSNQYDFDLLLQFLKDPGFEYQEIEVGHKKKIKHRIQSDLDLKTYPFIEKIESDQIIELIMDYIQKYFQLKEDYSIFVPFLNEKFLKEELAYFQLVNGRNQQNLNKIFSNEDLEEISNRKYIEICAYNKKTFTQGEDVKIHVKIKNIQYLNIKVFEVQLESYYLLKSKEIDSEIVLDGLIASEEINFQYQFPSFIEHQKVFTFETITKSNRGVFIIDFLGDGVQSRAIIKKGNLSILKKQTPLGLQFQILDENFNLCHGQRTGFWTRDAFHQIDPKSLDILLPFQQYQETLEIIIVHDEFAQLTNIEIDRASYKLDCAFIACRESYLSGMNAQMVILPRLFIGGQLEDLSLLYEIKVQVDCYGKNDMQLQTHEFVFKDLGISNGKIEISIPMNRKFVQLQYKISTNIENEELEDEFTLDLEGSDQILAQFLKLSPEGYEIYVYGKNGDPKCNIELEIAQHSSLLNRIQTIVRTTDQYGRVQLGKCENIKAINSKISNTEINDEWEITPIYKYALEKTILLGEKVELPFSDNFTIIQIDEDGNSLRNCTNYLIQNQFILFKPDVQGQYLILTQEEIHLTVVSGQKIDNELVVQENQLYRLENQQTPRIEINHQQFDDKMLVQCQLNSRSTQVIAVASQFQDPKEVLYNIGQLDKQTERNIKLSINENKNNIYISNRSLSDEIKYVKNRQQLKPQLGNQLQKPQILLKRQLQSETQTNLERESDKSNIPTSTVQNDQGRRLSVGHKVGACRKTCKINKNYQIQQINFLKNPAIILKDLNSKQEGVFSFEIPNNYQQITFYLINGYNITTQYYSLPTLLQTRDLTHKSQLNRSKFYTVVRNSRIIKENQEFQLNDKEIQHNLIQSNEQLFEQLLKLSEQSEFSKWKFLVDWHKLQMDQKHNHYSKYQSNELNLYLRFRDQDYFYAYVHPYISNKIDKDFIDYFLLEDSNKLLWYTQLKQQKSLNHLELLLLLIFFNEIDKDNNIAQFIYQIFINPIIGSKEDKFKKLFDKLLSSHSEDDIEISNNHYPQYLPYATKSAGKGGIYKCRMEDEDENEEEIEVLEESEHRTGIRKPHRFRPGSIMMADMKSTKEYSETHYYKLKESKPERISLNKFWLDLANHSIQEGIFKQRFLSTNFFYNCTNLTSLVSIMTFMHFSPKSQIQQQDTDILEGPALLFTKEVKETQQQINQHIILEQQYFDKSDPTQREVIEFLVDKIYGCKIIATNSSNEEIQGQLLVELPNGSIPVSNNIYNWSQLLILAPYSTQKLDEYYFYFPNLGTYTVYPANLSRNGFVEARANERELYVVKSRQLNKELQFVDVLEQDQNSILQYIKNSNVHDPKLFIDSLISGKLLRNEQFFKQLTVILRSKNYYSNYIWKYSMIHLDNQSIREYLSCMNFDQSIFYFKSNLIEINRGRFLEYYPLINQRAHKDSYDNNMILNRQYKSQWRRFLEYLIEKKNHDNNDLITLTYYLLIQEKFSQAITVYNKIQGQGIQYDYLSAYLDFVTGYPNFIKARLICEKYIDYPIKNWRNLFYEMLNQLTEFDQEGCNMEVEYNIPQKQIQLEETLSMNVIGQQLHIQYTNMKTLIIQFYLIDIELLFSISPFSKDFNEQLSFVKPNEQLQFELSQDQTKVVVQIPQELVKSNLQIQVIGQQKRVQSKYISTNIKVQVMQNRGILRVFDEIGKYKSHVYVKSFIRNKNNEVLFYKDGYTDIGGKFDYFSVSSPLYNTAIKFAILVIGGNLGSVVLEVNPPIKIIRYDQEEVQLLSRQQDFELHNTKKVKKD